MKRSEIRELTFRFIYSLEIQNNLSDSEIEEQLKIYTDSNNIKEPKDDEYIKDCIFGIINNKNEIDKEIIDNLKSEWKIERISKVNLSLLKLAIYEIKYKQIPFKAVINEVVELAKKYGDDQASKFINGMLAEIVKDM